MDSHKKKTTYCNVRCWVSSNLNEGKSCYCTTSISSTFYGSSQSKRGTEEDGVGNNIEEELALLKQLMFSVIPIARERENRPMNKFWDSELFSKILSPMYKPLGLCRAAELALHT